MSLLTSVVIQGKVKHTATVFWFHGLGDTGAGWSFLATELSKALPHVKWIFPNAPQKPVTLNGGIKMPAWFDLSGLDKTTQKDEDKDGILETLGSVKDLIQAEIDEGTPSNRIVVGGFSQGCVVSLLTGLTSKHSFAGIIGCSGWLAMSETIESMASEENKKTHILMCHGEEDNVVKYGYGKQSSEHLKKLGYDIEFKSYKSLAHSADPEELNDIKEFLKTRLP